MRHLLATASFFFVCSAILGAGDAQWLEVNLTLPEPALNTNVVQNRTFDVNATVFCRDPLQVLGCGDVNGTVRYNSTGEVPNIEVNQTEGVPFYVNETPGRAMKQCPAVTLNDGDFCNVTWKINATGDIDTNWVFDVLFNSSLFPVVADNGTDDGPVSIVSCGLDYTVTWSNIDFGSLNPNTGNNSAPGNAGNQYNVTVNNDSCVADFYAKGQDLRNATFDRNITVRNLTWSNVSSDPSAGFFRLDYADRLFRHDALNGRNFTSWFWLDTPPVPAGRYDGIMYLTGVVANSPPP